MPRGTPNTTSSQASSMWLDPDTSSSSGVLLSDLIRFYAERVNLIDPFNDSNLAPASYDLTLGIECWYSQHLRDTGEPKRILTPGEQLILPPNSITFVSTTEKLNMPFYLAARFNLKLRLLHEGLLIGAGPQIDPGFSGRLSCPLHNISSEKISLRCGDSFAVIEFHKTSTFAREAHLNAKMGIEEVRSLGESGNLKGIGGYPCFTFPARSLDREPIRRYVPPGRLVSSSLEGIEGEQRKLGEQVHQEIADFRTQMRTLNILAYIAVIAVALSLGTYFFAVVNWNKSVNDSTIRAEERIKVLESEKNTIERRLKDLETKSKEVPSDAPGETKAPIRRRSP